MMQTLVTVVSPPGSMLPELACFISVVEDCMSPAKAGQR